MIYVDGMEGVISHCDTIRWLYSLIASKVGVACCCCVRSLYSLCLFMRNVARAAAGTVCSVVLTRAYFISCRSPLLVSGAGVCARWFVV